MLRLLVLIAVFGSLSSLKPFSINTDEAVISENISQSLNIKVGDELILRVEKISVIPLSAPFSKDVDPSVCDSFKGESSC